VISGVVEIGPSGVDLHEVLIGHVPVRRRWWLLVRRPRCQVCGTRYPCWSRRQADRSLAAGPAVGRAPMATAPPVGVLDGHLPVADVAGDPPDDPVAAGGHGRSRLVRSFILRGYVDRGGNELSCTGRYP
jgi:hypothetical protein